VSGLVARHVVFHRVSTRTLYETLGSVLVEGQRRSDAASFRSASLRAQHRAQSSEPGSSQRFNFFVSSRFLIERYINPNRLRDLWTLEGYELRSLNGSNVSRSAFVAGRLREWRHDRIGVHGASRWSRLERSVVRNQGSSIEIAPRR
jgi:hypothetical protein